MWQLLISQIFIPELARALEARWAAGQPPPTADEMREILRRLVQSTVDEANAFLVSKGAEPIPVLPPPNTAPDPTRPPNT